MYDTHMHSSFSYDSSMTLDQLCQTAIKLGLHGVTVTDHANLNRFEENALIRNFKGMIPAFNKARDRYSNNLKLFCGIEIGEYLREPEKAKQILSLTDYDQIIAAIHFLDFNNNDITFAAAVFDNQISNEEIYQYISIYFDDLLKTAENFDFDVLAHITYPLRYINLKYERNIDIGIFENKIRQIYQTIIQRGIALEVNTSRFQEKYRFQLTPDEHLLTLYRSMGGERITLGSDAHIPQNIALGFSQARKILRELGFDRCCYFDKRKIQHFNI